MSKLVNNIRFTAQDKAEYKKTGVFPIRNIMPPSIIKRLRTSIDNNFKSEDQPNGVLSDFDRYSNEFANRDVLFKNLVSQLIPVLSNLCAHDLGVTMVAIFELQAGKKKGFKWHFDNYSFSFIDTDADAHTLWLPLHTIDVNKQKGGMYWVHQDDFSGKSRMQQWKYYQYLEESHRKSGTEFQTAYREQYPTLWFGDFDTLMMEDLKQTCSFDLGDAFLFNRHTWHRSQPLLPDGPIQKRTTVIFRLVDLNGTINRTFYQKTIERMLQDGEVLPKSFGDRLEGFKDGDLLRDVFASGVSY